MILITGATGRIGNVLLKEYCKRGERPRILVRKTSEMTAIQGCNFDPVIGDLLDPASIDAACKGVDGVFHLAGRVSISEYDANLTKDTNVIGTKNVVEACLKNKVKRLLYTSSIHAFSLPPEGQAINETTPLCLNSTRGAYDCSKAAATRYILDAVESRGLNAVIVAPTGVIGPFDYRPSLFGQGMINQVKAGLKTTIRGAYDYVDVRDVVSGIITAYEKGKTGEIYLLSGEQLDMTQYVQYLKEFSGIKGETGFISSGLALLYAKFRSFFVRSSEITPYSVKTLLSNSKVSHEKATRELGYNPRPVKESLRDQYEWFKKMKML